MKTITEFYQTIPQVNLLIPAGILILLIISIIFFIFEVRKCRKIKRENAELKTQNAFLQNVNRGMCLKKEHIVKELTDDLYLKKFAMEQTYKLCKANENGYNSDDVKDMFKSVYSCLTGKS